MFNLPSFRIGRFFGIPVEINTSWFIIFLLVAVTLTTSYFPATVGGLSSAIYILMGALTTLAFFGSVLLHEFSHSLVARAGGLKITKVTLFVFGGVSQMEEEPRSPGHEFVMASAGPGMSLVLAALLYIVAAFLDAAGAHDAVLACVDYLWIINLSLAIFNLLPGFPLDGGRVLRALLWGITGDLLRATRWASRMGQALGVGLIATAVLGVLLYQTLDLIWLAVMGWFLSTLAASAYQQQLIRAQLARVPLERIMSSPAALVPAATTLEEMAHSYFLGGRHSRYPVVEEDKVVGLVDLRRANQVDRSLWPETTAGDVARHDLADIVASPKTPVDRVLPRLDPTGPGAVLVVEDGRLAGIVTRADVIRLVRSIAEEN
ncbi:MAG: site-2 protease family protein [Coriobacteriia bacterium]